jgi:hypothetical protein
MTTKDTTRQLEDYERRYRELAHELAEIGFIAAGSVAPRYNRCGKPTCRCHGDPPRLHGPYFQWTAKVNGKTVNRRLTEDEATLYSEWIANDRRVRALITQMREVASDAQRIMLEQAASEAS